MKSTVNFPARHNVIRESRELWVLPKGLTPEEREEIAERQRSPKARRRFGARRRKTRRIEDKPDKDALKAALRATIESGVK